MQQPLEGIRVLELTIWIQGPLAGVLLAGLGAEVIKLEKPVQGDFSRGIRSAWGAAMSDKTGRSIAWEAANRGKKDVSLDLKTLEGREILHRLVDRSDVFLTNLSFEVLRAFGADRDTITARNPRILFAQATVAGPLGPEAEMPGQDTTGMARSGFMTLLGGSAGEPLYPAGALSDVMSATMLAFGVVTGLLTRERHGPTPIVDASQLGAMLWLQNTAVATYLNAGQPFKTPDRRAATNPLMSIYRCADDRWIALGLYTSQRFWPRFCASIGREELADDPRFATEDDRVVHSRDLVAILDDVLATKTRAEWDRIFKANAFWIAPVNRVEDLATDPQVVANDYLIELDNGVAAVSAPFQLGGIDTAARQGAPELGQHTEEVLLELAECTWDDIADLRERGII